VVFVDLPKVGRVVKAHESVATVESVKAASDVYVPVSGEVVEVNGELAGDPSLVNRAPEAEGWFMKVKLSNEAELSELMDKAAYDTFAG
jgi:glycine cleavage system H protein